MCVCIYLCIMYMKWMVSIALSEGDYDILKFLEQIHYNNNKRKSLIVDMQFVS